jgi:hypothetical protein
LSFLRRQTVKVFLKSHNHELSTFGRNQMPRTQSRTFYILPLALARHRARSVAAGLYRQSLSVGIAARVRWCARARSPRLLFCGVSLKRQFVPGTLGVLGGQAHVHTQHPRSSTRQNTNSFERGASVAIKMYITKHVVLLVADAHERGR